MQQASGAAGDSSPDKSSAHCRPSAGARMLKTVAATSAVAASGSMTEADAMLSAVTPLRGSRTWLYQRPVIVASRRAEPLVARPALRSTTWVSGGLLSKGRAGSSIATLAPPRPRWMRSPPMLRTIRFMSSWPVAHGVTRSTMRPFTKLARAAVNELTTRQGNASGEFGQFHRRWHDARRRSRLPPLGEHTARWV